MAMFRSVLFVFLILWSHAAKPAGESISIPLAAGPVIEISPMIYGLGHYTLEDKAWGQLDEIRPGAIRYGGNTSERFNFRINAWNTASDAGFANTGSSDPDFVGSFIRRTSKLRAVFAMTMPMLGWIAKDKSSVSPVGTSNPSATSEPLTPEYIKDLTRKVIKEVGPGPAWFIVGNEPMLWSTTHKDIHPDPVSYDEALAKYTATSQAIRSVSPLATIGGPALWGWLAMEQSSKDGDRKAHGDVPFLEWFVGSVGSPLLDFIDVHHYSENQQTRDRGANQSNAKRAARLRTTRALWDKNYVDESWIGQAVQLIPRLKGQRLAGGKTPRVAIGEYNFRGEEDISGALAQLETFAIFAEFGVDAAFYWTFPPPKSLVWKAWQLWRNPFGDGRGMEELWVRSSAGLGENLSVYGSRAPTGKRLTLMILNKSDQRRDQIKVDLDRPAKFRRAMALDSSGLRAPSQKIGVEGKSLILTLDSWSAMYVELEKLP